MHCAQISYFVVPCVQYLLKEAALNLKTDGWFFFKVEQVQGITITIFNRNMTVIFLSLILLRNMQSVFESSCH